METVEKAPLKTERSAKPEMQPAFISLRDAARLTGTTRQSWGLWARKGLFTSVRLNRRLLIPIAEFERVLSEGTVVRRTLTPVPSPKPSTGAVFDGTLPEGCPQ